MRLHPIETAIARLPPQEVERLAVWLSDFRSRAREAKTVGDLDTGHADASFAAVEVDAIAVALREAHAPSLAISRQFFSVHSLAADPVARVEERPDGWAVTLRLSGVKYYWMCRMERSEAGLTPVWAETVERARVYLSLTSDLLTLEEIGSRLGFKPTRSRRIGDLFSERSSRRAEWNSFVLDAPAHEAAGFDFQFQALLDVLALHESAVTATVEACEGGFINVAYEAWSDQMWGVGATPEQAALLGRLGLTLDVDLYAQGPSVPDGSFSW